jgi:hypothetical protein
MHRAMEEDMPAVFGVACFIAMFWSPARYQFAYNSVVDSRRPQFQDDLTSRYAFPVYVLEPSTPLQVQAEYMKSMWGSCAGALWRRNLRLAMGGGVGLYFDNHGRLYPQLYAGTPKLSLSAGYTPDLEVLLTGTSIQGARSRILPLQRPVDCSA